MAIGKNTHVVKKVAFNLYITELRSETDCKYILLF